MTAVSAPSSRLQELFDQHETQCRRIDELEQKMDEVATRKRRRISNLLDETSTHRRSHLRMFVTHHMGPLDKWTLVVEGKLLVGHLDHASVDAVEKEAAAEARAMQDTTADVDDAEETVLIRSTDRTLYRGKNEQEGDVPVEPTHFTHFFDKMVVTFQTIFQPSMAQVEIAAAITPKKPRGKNKRNDTMDEQALTTSSTTELVWQRGEDPKADAHAWFVPYTPVSAPPDRQLHSVASTITMWPRPGPDIVYRPSPALASALFPQHKTLPDTKRRKVASAKKRRRRSGGDEIEDEEDEVLPLDNDIVVPSTLTMKEIVSAIFFYIQEKKLQDQVEPSVIVNDKVLTNLFQCDRMNFADVQQILLSKNLIVDSTKEPIVITYILNQDTASPTLAQQPAIDHIPQIVSFDMDVYVRALFPYRAREVMRRIKRREFEYTSSRTKARNLLMRANEEVAKTRIEEAVCGRGFTVDHIPVWLALAKAAPAKSEARAAAQIDAKTCLLLDRLEHHCRAAKAAWDVVDACRGFSNS